MNHIAIIDKALASLDRLAASVASPAQAGEMANIRACLDELRVEDPQKYAAMLVPMIGKKLVIMVERGIQCIGADGKPLYDDDGKPLYKEADRGLLNEAMKFAEKHGKVKRDFGDDHETTATDMADQLRAVGRKKPKADDYDPTEDTDE
jgi:hypothetical protein